MEQSVSSPNNLMTTQNVEHAYVNVLMGYLDFCRKRKGN